MYSNLPVFAFILFMTCLAVYAIIPALFRKNETAGLIAASLLAGVYLCLSLIQHGWQPALATTLMSAITVQAILLAGCQMIWRSQPGLFSLFVPYALLLGGAGLVLNWLESPAPSISGPLSKWLIVHILLSVTGYGLIALSALAALAAMIRRWKLNRVTQNPLNSGFFDLPTLETALILQDRLLKLAALVLTCAVAAGTSLRWQHEGVLFALDHKSLLSLIGLALVLILLGLSIWRGVSGRTTAGYGLLLFLIFTLAYPGVKMVQQILLIS